MTLSDMLSELADHGFQDESTNRLKAMLNDAYFDICSREPWPFLETQANINTVAGTETLAVPSDFSQALTLTFPALGTVLSWMRLDEFQKNYAGLETQAGQPWLYYFIGNAIHLWPVPDSTYSLRMNYIKVPAAMSATNDKPVFPARHHRAVVLGAAVNLYAMEDDLVTSQAFESRYEKKLAVMRRDLWDQQYDRPDRIYDVFHSEYWADM